jgi:hypothetical protein
VTRGWSQIVSQGRPSGREPAAGAAMAAAGTGVRHNGQWSTPSGRLAPHFEQNRIAGIAVRTRPERIPDVLS